MEEEQESVMSTRTKINYLLDNIQSRLNKRAMYNKAVQNKGNIDIDVFQSFGSSQIPKDQNMMNSNNFKNIPSQYGDLSLYKQSPNYNNYFKISNNIPQNLQNNSENYQINEYYLRNLIKEEFSFLILPYRNDSLSKSNIIESKLDEIEKKYQILINAQNMGNLNDNAKIISAYLSSNLSNDNMNKSIEKLKIEYDTLFNELRQKIDSLNNQINMQKINNDSIISNFSKKVENVERKLNEEQNKEIKIYVEKDMFDEVIEQLNEKHNKTINDNDNNIRNIKQQIDTFNRLINQMKNDINSDSNKISGLNNNLNSLRTDYGKLTEDLSQVKYQVTPEIINKINSIDFNSLKQQVSQNEFNNLKTNFNIFETNLNSIKTMAENSDRSIYDLKKLITSVEQKQNLSNKNIENIQPLLNENVLDKINEINNKIKDINIKIEELSKLKNSIINNELKEENKEENNNEQNDEGGDDLFIGASRRKQRNNNKSTNNINKSVNNNLDEKSLNLIKQLEKINLNDLEKIDFNNILLQINTLTNDNKILSDKINEQNKTISEINEKINNIKNSTNYNNYNNNNSNNNNNNNNNYNRIPEQNPLDNNNIFNSYRRPEKLDDFTTKSMLEINDAFSKFNKTNDTNTNTNAIINSNNNNNNINSNLKNENNINDDKFERKKTDDIIEEDYDDFDKDFDDVNKSKELEKEKDLFNDDNNDNKKMNDIDDINNKNDDFLNDNKFMGNNDFNKKGSKNEFDKYAETNILDQIMGGSRRNNDFDLNNNFGGGGTFITGSLTGSKNNNYNIDKPPIFGDGNGSKNNEIKKDSKNEESKDNNNDDDFGDDFDNFEVEEI